MSASPSSDLLEENSRRTSNGAYNPRDVEDTILEKWERSGYFNPDRLARRSALSLSKGLQCKKPFSIVMPPPNATGILHIGHATMLAIEDIAIRYHRMKGDDTVWIPGTDHAAIATQNVVEKELWKTEHKTRHDLGREAFLKRVEAFVVKSKATIKNQVRKMGSSCDWSREAFTLDAARSRAVNAIFKQMYDDGLIYRGNRIVNWCPRCKSTLADDEVEYREEKAPFYYFKYGPVVIGTARPETKFLDKTIVVHPKDKRYAHLVGTEFDVEWIEGTVRANVIADPIVELGFGTGAMTITPAHSFEDFELAQKYHLPVTQIINENGDFTQAAGSFAGKNAHESRTAIVDILQAKGLVDHIDEHYTHNLSVCYRCGTPVEPLPKLQWFVAASKPFRQGKSLKDLAIAAVKSKKIAIIPERFTKEYFHWMNNLRDWCISRQIWYGHRIPVWYCTGKKSKILPQASSRAEPRDLESPCPPTVSTQPPKQCTTCGSTTLTQDPDTLDTWFSSGLWTFTALGWTSFAKVSKGKSDSGSQMSNVKCQMSKTDLERWHPTSVLETGYDIIFFWVARMILMTEYALKTIPFKTVYLHGLIRDAQGRKMSKSLGNVIDPLVVSEKFGTDAVRLSLVVGTTPGNDLKLSEQKIEGYRNFVNKLWNIARFVSSVPTNYESATNIRIDTNRHPELVEGSQNATSYKLQATSLSLPDRWILSRLQQVTKDVTNNIEAYRFSQAAETLRAFTWDELADWYIEVAKWQLASETSKVSKSSTVAKSAIRNPQSNTIAVLEHVLATLLKLWHPFTPFVTEAIWQELSHSVILSEAPPIAIGGAKSKDPDLLMIANWPKPEKKWLNPKAEKTFAQIQTIVREIRSVRSDFSIPPTATLTVSMKAPKPLREQAPTIEYLTKTHSVIPTHNHRHPELVYPEPCRREGSRQGFVQLHPIHNVTLSLDLSQYINLEKEITRIRKTVAETEAHLAQLSTQLKNKDFTAKAPKDIISTKRSDLASATMRLQKLKTQLQNVQS